MEHLLSQLGHVLSRLNQLRQDNFVEFAKIIVAAVTALWAIRAFTRNNRIKAAEILIQIEKDYSSHTQTWLKIENRMDYKRLYRDTLQKRGGNYTRAEREEMAELEKALQFMFACWNLKRMRVDRRTVTKLCSYNLRLIVDGKRPELQAYVKKYWLTIYHWAQVVGYPWPCRIIRTICQWPEKGEHWWKGRISDSRHP